MGYNYLGIRLKSVAAKNPDIPIGIIGSSALRRYRIKFANRGDYERALTKCDSYGFIEFSDGKAANLIGRLVRKAPDHLLLEVDAAEDIGILGG